MYRALVRAMVDSLAVEEDAETRREFRDRLRKRVTAAAEFATSLRRRCSSCTASRAPENHG